MKGGMPCYELKGGFCALYTSKTYATLSIMAPPEKLDDTEGKARHLPRGGEDRARARGAVAGGRAR
jgi:hypothetical protein